MLGRVLNTHQQWLCRRLADLGYPVSRQAAVPDTGQDIQHAVKESLSRADLVLTTGGLGPTSDDLTRDLIAQLLGIKLHEDAGVLENIRQWVTKLRRPMPDRMRVQALVPEGATVLANSQGTAPGLALQIQPNPFRPDGGASWLVMLPGPPRELRPMFDISVVPLLKRVLPLETQFVSHTFRTIGIGESVIQERISKPLEALVSTGLDLGYCARPGQVDVRLAALGDTATEIVREAESLVKAELHSHIFSEGDEELAAVIIRLLTDRGRTLTLAESCTGGCIAHQLTNVPGASAVLLGGVVAYSNEVKQKLLGVRSEMLAEHGAVSEPVARQMAEGARWHIGTDYALSVTGIAGPSGGSEAKPVGTVFIALAGPTGTTVVHRVNPFDRETFKLVTAQQALELLRRELNQG
jgi:nicotinamide-nucleotide amidase